MYKKCTLVKCHVPFYNTLRKVIYLQEGSNITEKVYFREQGGHTIT